MKILVLGWYHNGNLGDEAFKSAFCALWPAIDFTFDNCLINYQPGVFDGIWVGGGDLLDGDQFLDLPTDVPIAVIGVGFRNLSAKARALLDRAKVVVVRDKSSHTEYSRALLAPHLVFGMPSKHQCFSPRRRVTVLLNDFFNPRSDAPYWTHTAHRRFVTEFAKVIEHYVENNYHVVFYPMQTGRVDDRLAAAQVISALKHPEAVEWVVAPPNENELLRDISSSELIITQRLHGFVYSVICGRPCVIISGATKMEEMARAIEWPAIIDYYSFTDKMFFSSIESNTAKLRSYRERSLASWQDLSVTVLAKFNSSVQTD